MLPKKNRANRKEIEAIFKNGRFINSVNLTFKYIPPTKGLPLNKYSELKISFIAPKGVAKLAVKRNLLRRRGYVALKKYINQFPAGILGAFVFKKYQDDISIIENDIKTILHKIN